MRALIRTICSVWPGKWNAQHRRIEKGQSRQGRKAHGTGSRESKLPQQRSGSKPGKLAEDRGWGEMLPSQRIILMYNSVFKVVN
jgi:hypothetical protein